MFKCNKKSFRALLAYAVALSMVMGMISPQIAYATPTPSVEVAFMSLNANGGMYSITDELYLMFNKEVDDLTIDDITLVNASKGELTGPVVDPVLNANQYLYTLTISDIGYYDPALFPEINPFGLNSQVRVTMSKPGFAFTPATRDVTVRQVADPTPTPSVTPTATPDPSVTPSPSDIEGFIMRLYNNVFDRDPEPEGLKFWINGISSNTENASGIIYHFFFSPEFLEKEVQDDEFINIAYLTLMDRDPDEDGMNHWLRTMDSFYNRRRYVLEQMMTSNEFTAICVAYGIDLGAVINVEGFVARMYRYVLNRKYEQGGLDFWVQGLLSGDETGATLAANFFFDWEFEERDVDDLEFLVICYNVFMNRDPDEIGLEFWLEQLELGAGRRHVLLDMIDSDEFRDICESYNIEPGLLTLQ